MPSYFASEINQEDSRCTTVKYHVGKWYITIEFIRKSNYFSPCYDVNIKKSWHEKDNSSYEVMHGYGLDSSNDELNSWIYERTYLNVISEDGKLFIVDYQG